MNTIDMEVTPVDLAVTYEDMVQRLERAEKQIDLQRLQIAVLEAQQAPIAPEVPATVIHELFSKLTYEINILVLILTGPVVVETAHPRLAKGLEMLGEQWKGWIVDEATRSSVFEAFVWYEVAQYFGSQHRDIWAGKMGGAFKDVCKQLRSSEYTSSPSSLQNSCQIITDTGPSCSPSQRRRHEDPPTLFPLARPGRSHDHPGPW